MEKYKVYVSEPAENNLCDIVRYISVQLLAPTTALKMMDIIEEAIMDLAVMPQKFHFVVDERLATLGYRKLLVKNYIVLFTIYDKLKALDIKRILYVRRNCVIFCNGLYFL